MNRNDILAYLLVLNQKEILDEMSTVDFDTGMQNIMGCLYRVEDQLNDTLDVSTLLLLRDRERLNVDLAAQGISTNSDLEFLTKKLSERLYSKYIQREITDIKDNYVEKVQ